MKSSFQLRQLNENSILLSYVNFKVLGNCQVGGIADSLELLSNGSTVAGVLVSNDPKVLFEELSEHLKNAGDTVLLHESVREIILVN